MERKPATSQPIQTQAHAWSVDLAASRVRVSKGLYAMLRLALPSKGSDFNLPNYPPPRA